MNAVRRLATIMSQSNYLKEAHIAQLAVRRASLLTQKISEEHLNEKGISKEDNSPVTIGDFGAQAIIINSILKNFPTDEVVGEEDSGLIREKKIEDLIFSHVDLIQNKDSKSTEQLGLLKSGEEMCQAIDNGNSKGGNKGRIWALDPIDGTKGFLRGDQYAVCLALIVDGEVKVGVVGCPNLPHDLYDGQSKKGGLFTAIKGQGSFFQDLNDEITYPFNKQQQIELHNEFTTSQARVVEGVEKGHSSHGLQSLIKEKLAINQPSVNLDSQVKYCAVSKGDAEIYLRLPKDTKYREKIWDHAAGYLLVNESGGKVSDIYGNDLDFGYGRTLNSQGVIASTSTIHPEIIKAIKSIIGENGEDLEKFC
ncbi:3'(2'),5'-bisphosphate nucleotidase [Martiniozyma asiatica (nom. inval.)]|nr:3'(2'),5'-bisphosphate nucleotidase [Martiniozyma asiatica]